VAFAPDGCTILTGSTDGAARFGVVRRLPAISRDQLTLALKTFTGMELDEYRALRVMDEKTYAACRKALDASLFHSLCEANDTQSWHDSWAGEAEPVGNTLAALWHLDRLIAADSKNWWYHARRARVYTAAGLQAKADADDARAVALGPWDEVLAWYQNRIADMIASDHWPQAFGYAKRLVAARPQDPKVQLLHARIYQKLLQRTINK
jgi:predicted Zn-dependent protease